MSKQHLIDEGEKVSVKTSPLQSFPLILFPLASLSGLFTPKDLTSAN